MKLLKEFKIHDYRILIAWSDNIRYLPIFMNGGDVLSPSTKCVRYSNYFWQWFKLCGSILVPREYYNKLSRKPTNFSHGMNAIKK